MTSFRMGVRTWDKGRKPDVLARAFCGHPMPIAVNTRKPLPKGIARYRCPICGKRWDEATTEGPR